MSRSSAAEILADALELPPEERDAFLERACAGDAPLLAEARSLLEAHARADSLLPSDWLHKAAPEIAGGGDGLRQLSPEREIGREIGAYRLRRVLGAGGMGAVYLADRSDAEFAKQVAIKLVRPGMWTEDVVRRFWTERQVLANLEHPNVARLIDGGATSDGLPYLVMEYVDGVPFDVFCDQRALPIAERLRLFLQVCDAVAFAHRNLIVHRDLKPGNILVDGRGVPKLLDFGIAKILDSGSGSGVASMTRTGMRLLTPEYASPEQVRGEPVSTATDVYSLGVLLYELLTGRRPYAIRSLSAGELERTICEIEPPRPSTVVIQDRGPHESAGTKRDVDSLAKARGVRPDRLRRQIAGDLDNIVLTALRKEPERRYPSVERFAEDIRRHLDGLPVAARKDTWRYRGAKFARRNRVAVAAASALFLLVAAFAVSISLQAERIARERDRAQREAESARRIAQFLTDLFEQPQPVQAQGKTVTARELLDAGTQKIQEGLEDEPAVRAQLLRTMAVTYQSLGHYEPACSLLDKAIQIQTELYGPADDEHLSNTLADLAVVYRKMGRLEDSRTLHERVIGIRTAGLPPDHIDMAPVHSDYGTVLFEMGKTDSAAPHFEKALAIWDKALGPGSKESMGPLRSLANVAVRNRDLQEAEDYIKRCLEISEAECGSEHAETVWNLSELGVIYSTAGKQEEARVVLERALPLAERIFGPEQNTTARVVNTLAGVRSDLGDKAGARELFLRALAARRAIGPRHPSVANTLYHLGSVEGDLGNTEIAFTHFDEARSILEESLGPDHPNLPFLFIQHGKLLVKVGRHPEAEALYLRAEQIWQKISGPHHPRMVEVLLARGGLERSRRRFEEADRLYASALKICADSLTAHHKDAVKTRKAYAAFLREMGDEGRAAELEQ